MGNITPLQAKPKNLHTPSPSRIPASHPISHQREEHCARPNFSKRQSKRQRRKPSCKRLSVSSLPSSVRICTLYLPLAPSQPTPDSAGDPTIGQQREAQGRQSASQPTTAHRLILPLSPDPVVGLGSPTTDARVPYVPFLGPNSWGRQHENNKNSQQQHEHTRVASSPIPPSGP